MTVYITRPTSDAVTRVLDLSGVLGDIIAVNMKADPNLTSEEVLAALFITASRQSMPVDLSEQPLLQELVRWRSTYGPVNYDVDAQRIHTT